MYKTSIQILGALIILLSLSCSENYQGKYFQENNFNQYIQLEPDGKFLIKKSNGFEKGTYGIKNGAIALLTKEK